jgi:beta-lactamase superfamily II metal-dependent hydrolase
MAYRWLMAAFAACWLAAAPAWGDERTKGLNIYWVDTEGGAATLIVTPAGESILIDCGNPGPRDGDRIYKVATEQAGIKAIDHLIITHWHTDHYGGVARLSERMPIHHFYDHGIPDKLIEDPKNFPLLIQAYKNATKGQSRTLRPGDEIALKQQEETPPVRLRCLCGSGEVVPDRPGIPENPIAREHKPQANDPSDNARSLGFLLSYGDFRFLDLGDLTWNKEYKLVHPTDKIGPVDVYQATHHGLDISNNPVVIKTVQPRVVVFGNGPHKGAMPAVMTTLRRLPEVPAIFQLHRNLDVGASENTDPEFIANHDDKCAGEWVSLAVSPDSKHYTVTVSGKGKPHRYRTRGQSQ